VQQQNEKSEVNPCEKLKAFEKGKNQNKQNSKPKILQNQKYETKIKTTSVNQIHQSC